MINGKSVTTIFESCHIENNTSQKDLFNIQSTNIQIKNITFIKNIGRIISCLDVVLNIQYYSLSNHSCISVGIQGCYAYLESSNVTMSNIILEKIKSSFTSGLIAIQFSNLTIERIYLFSIDTLSSALLLNGKNSSITLKNCDFEEMNKSLIYLESSSNLEVLSSNFTSINVNQTDLSLIFCKNCENVTFKLNLFIECTSLFTAGAVTWVSGKLKKKKKKNLSYFFSCTRNK